MGIGNVYPYSIPSTVLNLTDVAQVSGGSFFSTALKADGTVWAWGLNSYGQIGNGTVFGGPNGAQWHYTPQQSSISDVVQISSGYSHTIALKSDGTVWGWGYGAAGQAGPGGYSPARIGKGVSGFENIIAVSSGASASAAVKSDGTVWVWGSGSFGLNGDGAENSYPYSQAILPRQVPNFGDVVQIAAGDAHFAALKRDGTVWVWGINTEGQCGAGTLRDFMFGASGINSRRITMCLTPRQVISDVVEIKSGGWHLLARKRDGSVWVWGANWEGQIGDGTSAYYSLFYAMPNPAQAPTGTGNALIGAATRSSYAVKPVIQTPAGFGVKHYGENVRMLFSNVISSGMTSYTAIDPAMTGLNVPSGYEIQPNEPAYNVTTTAQTSGDIEVCVKVNEYNRAEFPFLKILHAEGANLVDRTFSSDYTRRQICARVDSLASFVIAKPSAAITNYELRKTK